MLNRLFRVSSHPLVRWWWSMDRASVFIIFGLMVAGGIVSATASISVADTYNVAPYYFAKKQILFLCLTLPIMFWFSFHNIKGVKRMGVLLFVLAFIGLIATLIIGVDVKGAHRWVRIAGFSFQPSELMKPALVLLTASLVCAKEQKDRAKGFVMSIMIMSLVAVLLLLQPDFGMFLLMSIVWFAQMALAGIPFLWLSSLAILGGTAASAGYLMLPHVQSRIMRFLNPDQGDTYQVDQAAEAFMSGGFFGRGLGEGVVKDRLPDAHTDFVFAVIGEEFGIITCLILLAVYGVFIWRGFSRVLESDDRFPLLAGMGLLLLFALQILVNMGVVLHVLPTTGMTLPFMSYGGSGTLSVGITTGLILALTRKRGIL